MIRIIFLLLLLVVATAFISRYLGPDDLADCPSGPTSESGCQVADAIIAVSGGDTNARTKEAIRLYHEGWAPKLVFSGAAEDKDSPSNAAVMRDTALSSGVPEEAVIIDEHSRTTKQNAKETADLLKSEAITSIILVTSGYHQRRTSLEFGERFKAAEIRNHPVSSDRQWSSWWWLTPNGWYLALGELARIVLFYLGGTR